MRQMLSVPKVRQEGPYCGPASLSMLFKYYGKNINQHEIVGMAGGQFELKKGMSVDKVGNVAYRYGFEYHSLQDCSIDDLCDHIDEGHPLIVIARAAHGPQNLHYYIVTGYDIDRDCVHVNDPAGERKVFGIDEFLCLWDLSRRNLPSNQMLLIHPKKDECPTHHFFNPQRH